MLNSADKWHVTEGIRTLSSHPAFSNPSQELHSSAAASSSRFVAAARRPAPAGSAAGSGVWVPSASLRHAPASLLAATRQAGSQRHVRAHHGLLTDALCHCDDGEARRRLYAARESLSVHALPVLEEMLATRAQLANATGHSSYAGYAFHSAGRVAASAEEVSERRTGCSVA